MNDNTKQIDFEALEAAQHWLVHTIESKFKPKSRHTGFPEGHPMLNEFLRENVIDAGNRFDVWTLDKHGRPHSKINHDPIPYGRALYLKDTAPSWAAKFGCVIKRTTK